MQMSQETADKILYELRRIADAVENLAAQSDPKFEPKSLVMALRWDRKPSENR